MNVKHPNGIVWGEGGDLPFTWTLSGGTLRTTALGNMGSGDVIDFPDGSTGTLQVLNSALDPAALEALVSSGNITKNGAPVDPSEFSISVVDVDGTSYTELLSSPSAPFVITEFHLDRATDMFTLTWNSKPGKIYTLNFSTDLTDLSGDIKDDINSQGASTSYGPFTVDADDETPGIQLPRDLFFRISENPPAPVPDP